MEQKAGRRTKLILIIGFNGTGKSTFVQKLIDSYLSQNKRSLICTPHDVEWLQYDDIKDNKDIVNFTDVKKKFIFDDTDLDNVIEYFRRGLLVFDDCRAYLPDHTTQSIKKLMISRRQRMIDIVAVAHGFTDVPPKFFTYASEIVLFNTNDNISSRKGVLKNFQFMEKQKAEIDKIAETKPHYYRILKQ